MFYDIIKFYKVNFMSFYIRNSLTFMTSLILKISISCHILIYHVF